MTGTNPPEEEGPASRPRTLLVGGSAGAGRGPGSKSRSDLSYYKGFFNFQRLGV